MKKIFLLMCLLIILTGCFGTNTRCERVVTVVFKVKYSGGYYLAVQSDVLKKRMDDKIFILVKVNYSTYNKVVLPTRAIFNKKGQLTFPSTSADKVRW